MARRRWHSQLQPAPLLAASGPEPMTAAAVTVAVNNPPSHVLWGGSGWQQEIWGHYDTTPELHAAANIMGYAFSRAKMIAVDVDPLTLELGEEPTTDPVATALVARLFGGPTGRAQAQKAMGQHLTGPGECWVLASDDVPDADQQGWQILSVGEVTKAGNKIRIQQLDGTQRDLLDTELLFRMFNPHPRRRWYADSPSLALLPVFRELAGLSAQIMASIRSRLATGGLLMIPDSIAPPTAPNEKGEQVPFGVNGWMRRLAEAMVTAIANPEDPSSLVPIVMSAPDDALKAMPDGPMRFVQEIMADVQPLREAAQKRIGIGMDMPPEFITGMGDVNHWGQWFISESFVKGPLDGALSLPADAFTTHYLRPGLRIVGKNPDLFAVRFQTDHMIVQANEANAQLAYTAGELSADAYLTALHFDPVRDAATEDERLRRLIFAALERGNPQTLAELGPTIKRLFPGLTLAPVPDPTAVPTLDAGAPHPAPVAPAPSTTVTQQPPTRPTTTPDNTPTAPPGS